MVERRPTLLLVDGHSLVYRAFFAMPALANSRGEMTNAAYGFTSMLLKALADHKPSHAIAAFDPPGLTFRHAQDSSYKAQRAATPPELIPQFPWCRDVVRALGWPIVEISGFEADDVIGTLATQAQENFDVIIVTGDLDFLQLVSPHIRVFANKRGITETVVYDEAAVLARYGFEPVRVIDFKALQGDVSDNIPGIPGIGAKTATTLIQEYGDLESILAAAPTMKEGKVKRLLLEFADQARLSRDLATIDCHVDVKLDTDAAKIGAYDPAQVKEVFERLEFRSLLARVPPPTLAAPQQVELFAAGGSEKADASQVQVTTEIVTTVATAEKMAAELRHQDGAAIYTVIEARERHSRVVGVALAAVNAPHAYYIPLEHEKGGNAGGEVIAVLRALIADVPLSGYDLKAQLLAWGQHDVELVQLDFDCMLAAYVGLTTRTRVPSLTILAQDLCGADIGAEDSVLGSGRQRITPAQLDVAVAADYYGGLAAWIPPVATALRRGLAEGKLAAVFAQLEMPLIPLLAEMEKVGVKVDCDQLAGISQQLQQRITEMEAEIQDAAGYTFNIGSTQQLARFLYEDLKLAAGRRTKTGRSTDADTLESLRLENPVVGQILEWRQLTKLKSTYVDALPLLCADDSRIHTTFNQAVAATGRLSSVDPNLQNVPIRSEWGQKIRRCFVADNGCRLLSADYSQIELRVLAHVSQENELIAAFARGEDIHRRTAAEVYHVAPEAVTPEMRRVAKVVNFGVVYGLSDFGLARDTGMDKEAARAFIDAYFASFPAVTAWLEQTRMQAREWGYVETFMGRRRHLPDIRAANRMLRNAAERMAVNMPIQGGAADIMKLAMIACSEALSAHGGQARILLQVHDELVLEAPSEEIEALIPVVRRAMEGAYRLSVPLDVDVKVGDNWQEMTVIKDMAHAGTS